MRKTKLSSQVHGQTMLKKYNILDLKRSTVQNRKINNKQGTANEIRKRSAIAFVKQTTASKFVE